MQSEIAPAGVDMIGEKSIILIWKKKLPDQVVNGQRKFVGLGRVPKETVAIGSGASFTHHTTQRKLKPWSR